MAGSYGGFATGTAAYDPVVSQSSFGGGFPSLVITEIAFASNPLDDSTAVWTDVSKYVGSIQVSRGRQHELNRFEAGTATIVLDNKDGRFSPFNTSSPYNPNVLPYKQIRVRALYNGLVYPIFRGHIEAWPVKWPSPADSTVEVHAVDITKLLNQKKAASLSTYAATITADSPAHYYKLDDAVGSKTVVDTVTGSALGLVNTSTPGTADVTAQLGAATAIVASNGTAFDCGTYHGAITFNHTGGTTVELWMQARATNASGYTRGARLWWSKSSTTNCWIAINDGSVSGTVQGTVNLHYDDGTNIRDLNGVKNVADQKPHQIVGVIDGTNHVLNIYVDGTLDATLTDVAVVGSYGGSNSAIGGEPFSNTQVGVNGYTFNGVIDEVSVFSTVLTATQVANHYLAGAQPLVNQTTGARMSSLLSAVGIPSSLQSLDTGQVVCQGATNDAINNSVLANCQVAADTELGDLFVSSGGVVTYYDQTHRYRVPLNTAAVVLGDSGTIGPGGESPYLLDSVDIQFDDLDLYNEVTVTPSGLGAQTATNSTSQTSYGKRTLARTGIQKNLSDAVTESQMLVDKYGTPLQRIRSLSFTPLSDPTVLLPAALGFELLTRVTVKRRPKDGAGSTFTQDSLIEGVEHTITNGYWQTTWRLSPTDASPIFFVLDDPVAGQLNGSGVLV